MILSYLNAKRYAVIAVFVVSVITFYLFFYLSTCSSPKAWINLTWDLVLAISISITIWAIGDIRRYRETQIVKGYLQGLAIHKWELLEIKHDQENQYWEKVMDNAARLSLIDANTFNLFFNRERIESQDLEDNSGKDIFERLFSQAGGSSDQESFNLQIQLESPSSFSGTCLMYGGTYMYNHNPSSRLFEVQIVSKYRITNKLATLAILIFDGQRNITYAMIPEIRNDEDATNLQNSQSAIKRLVSIKRSNN